MRNVPAPPFNTLDLLGKHQRLEDQKGKVVYKGKVESATQMKGDVDYASLGKGTWTAKKK